MFLRAPKSFLILPVALAIGCAGVNGATDSVASPMVMHESVDKTTASYRGATGLAGLEQDAAEGRKVIKTGNVNVIVPEWDGFSTELTTWLVDHGAHIQATHLTNHADRVGYANLTLRIPADQLDAFVSWADGNVKVSSIDLNSQDVTMQWTDLSARLDNAKRAETRMARILEHETGSLADVLAVEKELTRIRGDIESMEGRLRAMNDKIAMSTINLHVSVEQPLLPSVAPSFAEQIAQTFVGSLGAMKTVGKGGVLAAVAASPWLAVLLGFFGTLGLGIRQLLRRP